VLGDPPLSFAVCAHSYAEAYTALVGLTPAQTFDTIRSNARTGGAGARLYDRLIGAAAVAHDIKTIVTWNIGRMRGLFPWLTVLTPKVFLERPASPALDHADDFQKLSALLQRPD
jgi:hypothetical protein